MYIKENKKATNGLVIKLPVESVHEPGEVRPVVGVDAEVRDLPLQTTRTHLVLNTGAVTIKFRALRSWLMSSTFFLF